MFLGFAGEGFKQGAGAAEAGQAGHGRRLHGRHDALRVTDDGQKQMITAHITRSRRQARSARCIRRSGSSGSTRTNRRPRWRSGVVRRGPLHRAGRLRAAGSSRRPSRSRSTRWSTGSGFGFGVLGLGTLIALMPEAPSRSPSARRGPWGRTTAASMLLVLLMRAGARARRRVPCSRGSEELEGRSCAPAAAAADERLRRWCPTATGRRRWREVGSMIGEGHNHAIRCWCRSRLTAAQALLAPPIEGLQPSPGSFPYRGRRGAVRRSFVSVPLVAAAGRPPPRPRRRRPRSRAPGR